ncbi:MAG: serine/threonine-protein kinase [Burkholderiales bacterium]
MSESKTLPGERKLGRYEIVAELGKGAMGTVYKAVDPLLERTVALKTISISASDPEMAEYEARFYQEAKAAGGLNHPNIVTIYDVGKNDDLPYLAMEYLEGSELRHLLRNGKPLAVAHALEIAAQVADGLAYAHERGVIHRDIKPANIMVVRDGIVKIADFGVARMRSSERGQDTHVVGSPRYMSPEQVLRKRAEQRSDIFSLGVVLYEMLSGSPPFTGGDLNAIMFQIVNFVPPAPSTALPGTPGMLDFIVSKVLAKAPDDRYQTARELAADLRECRSGIATASKLSDLALPRTAAPNDDPFAATPLFGKSYPARAQLDASKPEDEEATTLGLSKDFDSLSATARLAAETGVAEQFSALIATLPKESPESTTVYGTVVRDQSSPRLMSSRQGGTAWDRTQRLIFSASVAVAAVVAALIVFA